MIECVAMRGKIPQYSEPGPYGIGIIVMKKDDETDSDRKSEVVK